MADRISIIVTSGTREKLQMAAMVASVAAVSGAAVTVFLSMNALALSKRELPRRFPTKATSAGCWWRRRLRNS